MKRLACLKKPVSVLLTASLLNLSVPYAAFRFEPARPEQKPKPMPASRLLSVKEMRSMSGAVGANPYLAGSQKWASQYKGVDLTTGNFSTSATDLSFEGGYGIPVNVTRSYSANNPDEGPLGVGWTLSVDLRTTAGGLLKSGSAPVRAVPTQFRERFRNAQCVPEQDPRVGGVDDQPVEAMVATDAGGTTETMQRDVDGVVTPPAWDQNVVDTKYETRDGYEIALEQTVTTPEGTVYAYSDHGDIEVNDVPSNILKVDLVTDRHGNETTYAYGATVTFAKNGATATEDRLESVAMPGGRTLDFVWSNGRIASVTDGAREVVYGYTDGRLASAASPEGKTTSYAWTDGLLAGITDPRGLTTTLEYSAYTVTAYGTPGIEGVAVKYIHAPNGTRTLFLFNECSDVIADPYGQTPLPTSGTGRHRFIDAYSPSPNTWVGYNWMPDQQPASQPSTDPDSPLPSSVLAVVESGIGGALKQSFYDKATLNLIREEQIGTGAQADMHGLGGTATPYRTRTNRTYNFLGQPLSVQTRELNDTLYPRTTWVQYAYWGKDRYFQQKATRDWNGRYTFTDYFASDDPDGTKGQVKATYATGIDSTHDNEFDGEASEPNDPGSPWRSTIELDTANIASARFDYDGEGRPVSVEKLHHFNGSTPVYVETATSYDATTGLAQTVVEDYGGIGRTTQTLAWDPAGRATLVQDATGRQLQTTYDDDGKVLDVTRVDGSHNDPIVMYTYGDAGVENGMPVIIEDALSGVTQYLSYHDSSSAPWSYGQLAQAVDMGTNGTTTMVYDYNRAGDREQVQYHTDVDSTSYRYADYITVGLATNPTRAFQTMAKMGYASGSWGLVTSEEFHYAYDGSGRLLASAFAQTPEVNYTPAGGQTYYPVGSHPASSRARTLYAYDLGGRTSEVSTVWDVWNGTGYTTTPVLANQCDYELSVKNRGLKTVSRYYAQGNLVETQKYGYDAFLDVLTGATYDGSTPGTNWTYDAAGNRANSGYAYDALNRMTDSPGCEYENDLLGNRTLRENAGGEAGYLWDDAGRLASYTVGGTIPGNPPVQVVPQTHTYVYRADGMRVLKIDDWGVAYQPPEEESGTWDEELAENLPTTRYAYDGQMCALEDFTRYLGGSTMSVDKKRYALGARGIEMIESRAYDASGWSQAFPLYDGHGNMIATLSRGTGGTYQVSNLRSFDAWGGVRSGTSTGTPSQRYCASLGHVQDDESSLIYMRARYYEPSTGRFVSEDPARDGWNWFCYADNMPTDKVDSDGQDPFFSQLVSIIVGLLRDFGFRNLAAAAWDMAAGVLADRLKKAAYSLIGKAGAHQGEAAALNLRQDWLGKAAAGHYSKLAAKEMSAGLTLLSISNFLKFSDDFDDLGPYMLL